MYVKIALSFFIPFAILTMMIALDTYYLVQ